jgi:hypothetical protein
MDAMSSPSSFAYWLRGAPVSSSAAASTGHFDHAYRGWVGAPVVRVGSAQAASASGGLGAGGSASAGKSTSVETASALALGGTSAAAAAQVVLAGGGLSVGGSRPASLASIAPASGGAALGGSGAPAAPAYATSGSFRYWRGGASVSSTAASPTGHFDHAFRGSVGLPVASPPATRSLSATASGGLRLGASAVAGRWFASAASGGAGLGGSAVAALSASPTAGPSVAATFGGSSQYVSVASTFGSGGLASGGSSPPVASYRAEAGGGLSAGGRAPAGLSRVEAASGGLGLGGARTATLSAAPAAGGGAAFGGLGLVIDAGYRIYVNDGHGGPIDYATPVATVYSLTWTSPALDAPGSYKFGVRSFDASGLEEQNLDASARLDLDASGADVTRVPLAPLGVRALALAGGRVRVEWTSPTAERRRRPAGFRVYAQAGDLTDYTTPAAVAPNTADLSGVHAVEIGPLVDGVEYAIGVRAYNASGEEKNTSSVRVGADAAPPSPVDSLRATPLSRVR